MSNKDSGSNPDPDKTVIRSRSAGPSPERSAAEEAARRAAQDAPSSPSQDATQVGPPAASGTDDDPDKTSIRSALPDDERTALARGQAIGAGGPQINAGANAVVGGDLGRYHLDHQIAQSDGVLVFAATDTRLDRKAAVKVLTSGAAKESQFLAAFKRQATLMARLESPHVISVYGHGTTNDGAPYLVTRYADGGDLGALLRSQAKVPGPIAAAVCAQVADALAAVHSLGVVHRDVRPSNILLRDTDLSRPYAYLSDFAAASDEAGEGIEVGSRLGSMDYLAPERVSGESGSASSDLYSLGCVFYQLVTGNAPYSGDSDLAVGVAHVTQPVPTLPGNSEFTVQANDLIGKLLSTDPERRGDAIEARDRLSAMSGQHLGFASGASVVLHRAKKRIWVAAAAVLAVLVAGGAAVGITLQTTDNTPAKPKPAITGDVSGDRRGDLMWGDIGAFSSWSGSIEGFSTKAKVTPSTGHSFGKPLAEKFNYANLRCDIDADGREDAVQASGTGTQFQIQSNAKHHADGSMQLPLSGYRLALFCSDFNADGRADIAMLSIGNGKKLPEVDSKSFVALNDLKLTVTIAFSKEDGVWAKSKEWFSSSWRGSVGDIWFSSGDLDGDKRAEITFGAKNQSPAVLQVLKDRRGKAQVVRLAGSENPASMFDKGHSQMPPTFADVDGDGRDELVLREYPGKGDETYLTVYKWDQTRNTFTPRPSWTLKFDLRDPDASEGFGFADIAVSDLNGDGRDDLVNPVLYGDDIRAEVLLSGKSRFSAKTWKIPGDASSLGKFVSNYLERGM